MSHEAYNDMIERMKLTVELLEADRDLKSPIFDHGYF